MPPKKSQKTVVATEPTRIPEVIEGKKTLSSTWQKYVLLFVATIGVLILGYTAFSLWSSTLIYPFSGADRQQGKDLQVIVSPPKLALVGPDESVLDIDALKAATHIGGQSLASRASVSGEYDFVANGGYIGFALREYGKANSPIRINASIYNKIKKTRFRLPRDITLTPSDIPKDLQITRESDPKDQTYMITLYGLGDARPEDIRFYVHSDQTATCTIRDWGMSTQMSPGLRDKNTIVSGEPTPSPTKNENRWIFRELNPEILSPSIRDGQMWKARVKLPYDLDAQRICIIGGVSGQYRIIEDRTLEPFSVTGSLIQAISPEFDMKSQVEFRFSHDIYTDSGVIYSPEYIAHRRDAKIAFLKTLDISPHVDVTPDDVILTPDRTILTLPLAERQDYTFSLRDITDIYGRKSSSALKIKPESAPFLSLKLQNQKLVYTTGEPIEAKLYALASMSNTYTLRLCQVDIESYSRVERMIVDRSLAKNALVSDVLSHGKNCHEKDIIISSHGYVSPFRIDDFFPGGVKNPGLYLLFFQNQKSIASYQNFVSPIIFSVIDTHITLKVDASGKILVQALDIANGKPRTNQEIRLLRNITRTHKEKWNPTTRKNEIEYLPLTAQSFATGVILGKTDETGFLSSKVTTLTGSEGYDANPYGLAFQNWWDYEGRYDSFVVESRDGVHLGYLVSTWNDGITGYNFGIKDSDYSWWTRGEYTSYIHTDRRLYTPNEMVHIHAIIRANDASLSIPKDATFDLVITDPLGREVKRSTLKPNEFGSISQDYSLPKDAPLGQYMLSLFFTRDRTMLIENAFSSFQVEVFKNPTFTASVELKSSDLEGASLKDLRKIPNDDPYSPWYKDVYTGNLTIQGIVRAKYYNGADIKNTSFRYRVYRSEYYDTDYWSECFWGCYYEPGPEQYTEGSGTIDGEGYGILRIPVEYRSSYSDYKYTVEVTVRDTITGEEVTTPGSLIVKLPEAYKSFSSENPLIFTPYKKILSPGEALAGNFSLRWSKWDKSLSGKYQYSLIRHDYEEVWMDDIRAGKVRVTTPRETEIASGSILSGSLSERLIGAKAGEYTLRIVPITQGEKVPESAKSETNFYISGDMTAFGGKNLHVIPERTVYRLGDIARVIFQVPFTGATLLITQEKGGIISKESVTLSGNTLLREYHIDDRFVPNVYIGAVALRTLNGKIDYSVGYGEIVTDITDKKSNLLLQTDKTTYKNRETVTLDMTLTDRRAQPLQGEMTVMVVDESLIRLLGNIDLDILPKFFQKYPFTIKTALTAIGMERSQFLSRKGSNGGGGDKGGGGVEIATRTLFQNTAYYNPSIITDEKGKARISFALPDNVTDYRIIVISNTRDSQFSVAQKTIEVRKDYTLEVAHPMILRNGDTFTFMVQAFNATKRITPVEISLRVGTGASQMLKKTNLSLAAFERKGANFFLAYTGSWRDSVDYTVNLTESGVVLDSVGGKILLPELPVLTEEIRHIDILSGSTYSYTLPETHIPDMSPSLSRVNISLSPSYLGDIHKTLNSLISYPYGCIEQTISSTFPNRIALSLSDLLGQPIEREQASKNNAAGLEKILAMQHNSGGWTYWQGDYEPEPHITPYVLRMLMKWKELGDVIPSQVFDNGVNYIIANESLYRQNMDDFAEAIWTLAILKDSHALLWYTSIDPAKLSRHGYVAYAYASAKLSRYTPDIEKKLIALLDEPRENSWYWTGNADRAIIIQLLFERGDRIKALRLLVPYLQIFSFDDYYISTQEKIQTFLAIIAEAKNSQKIDTPQSIALRGTALISDISLSPQNPLNTVSTVRERVGKSYTLRRDVSAPPLIVTTTIRDIPRDITKLPGYSTGGVTVDRVFELVDESKGVDRKGEFIGVSPVVGNIFKKGQLYRVTLRANLKNPTLYWSHLAFEDFFPAAWRPLNTRLQTESSVLRNEGSLWNYVDSREDRLLTHIMYGSYSTVEYRYYIRPEFVGEYLLPPATAYFLYNPDRHAYTAYGRVKVVE